MTYAPEGPRRPGFTPHPQQPGWPPQPPPQQWGGPPPGPPPKKKHTVRNVFLIIGGVFVALIVIGVAVSGGGGGNSPSATPSTAAAPAATGQPAKAVSAPKASPSRKAAGNTVTYSVTGSPADVTYGPAGSDIAGTVPMSKTAPLDSNASYYAINAQLNGSGTVSCSISVNGKVIDHATASGDYNIASCEITPNLLGTGWESANG